MSDSLKFFDLPNIGILEDTIPEDLYLKLLDECLSAQKYNEKMISGLSTTGIPEHYFLQKYKNDLQNYIEFLVVKYINKYNYLKTITLFSKDLNLRIDKPWINFQKKYEFLPNHLHDGILSYSIWIKVPYNEDEEKKQKCLKYDNVDFYSFQFSYNNILGKPSFFDYKITKKTEKKILLFPSNLIHCVYPFYSSNDYRISISGNITLDIKNNKNNI